MKHFLSAFIVSVFLCMISLPTAQAANVSDLSNHWSSGDVNNLITRGAIGGYPDGTFRPDITITRAEFSKILRQSLELTSVEGNDFTDTVNHWAVTDIHTLVNNQIIIPTEYGSQYGPDTAITRREIAIMLVRAMELNDAAAAQSGQPTGFSDDTMINSYDKGYLYLAKELGLVSGYEDGSFKPNNKATRAEASVMIVRLLNLKDAKDTSNLVNQINSNQQQDQTVHNTQTEQANNISNYQTINQVQYQLNLKEATRSNRNNLGEQYIYATLQITINNQSKQSITVSNDNLQTIISYSNGAQVTAIEQAFTQAIPAGQTKTINASIHILFPDNTIAAMVLSGNQINNINTQLTIANQTITFPIINEALLKAVQ